MRKTIIILFTLFGLLTTSADAQSINRAISHEKTIYTCIFYQTGIRTDDDRYQPMLQEKKISKLIIKFDPSLSKEEMDIIVKQTAIEVEYSYSRQKMKTRYDCRWSTSKVVMGHGLPIGIGATGQ